MNIIFLVFIGVLFIASANNVIALSRFFRPILLTDRNQFQEPKKSLGLSSDDKAGKNVNINKLRLAIKTKEGEEEKRRTFFKNHLERRLAASAILRDFYSGRY